MGQRLGGECPGESGPLRRIEYALSPSAPLHSSGRCMRDRGPDLTNVHLTKRRCTPPGEGAQCHNVFSLRGLARNPLLVAGYLENMIQSAGDTVQPIQCSDTKKNTLTLVCIHITQPG